MKIQMEMTLEEAAKQLRSWAELTAKNSQNWDNFETICLDILEFVHRHGFESAFSS